MCAMEMRKREREGGQEREPTRSNQALGCTCGDIVEEAGRNTVGPRGNPRRACINLMTMNPNES